MKFFLMVAIVFSSLMIAADDSSKQKRIEKQIQKQMQKEEKFAREQTFY